MNLSKAKFSCKVTNITYSELRAKGTTKQRESHFQQPLGSVKESMENKHPILQMLTFTKLGSCTMISLAISGLKLKHL